MGCGASDVVAEGESTVLIRGREIAIEIVYRDREIPHGCCISLTQY